MKIVFIGGGTGLSRLAGYAAEFWKEKPSEFDQLTVIQHPYDDGGHSGLIVKEYGVFGPGDFRKSILALSKPWMNPKTYKAFTRRTWHPELAIPRQQTMLLEEPPLGNLTILSGMLSQGDINPGQALLDGIEVFSDVCRLKTPPFKILPISLDVATLTADLADGTTIVGQSNITKHSDFGERKITSLRLVQPKGYPEPQLYEAARRAIIQADKIVFTSGSWKTSIRPNTLPLGFNEAIAESKAKIIMVVNAVTDQFESSRWNSGEFVRELLNVTGRSFDAILINDWNADLKEWPKNERYAELLDKYERQEFFPVRITAWTEKIHATTVSGVLGKNGKVIKGCFVTWDGKSFFHNENTVRKILDL